MHPWLLFNISRERKVDEGRKTMQKAEQNSRDKKKKQYIACEKLTVKTRVL